MKSKRDSACAFYNTQNSDLWRKKENLIYFRAKTAANYSCKFISIPLNREVFFSGFSLRMSAKASRVLTLVLPLTWVNHFYAFSFLPQCKGG